ncbi:serine hydrolase domain-containing protein [Idiomarina xiamenensis]|uniref:Beta-lactamase n=1 Tax=Idiomarina xiamenensis 10-D-4 TaxID=740709 RepID=K2KAZ4_9GAMM|nr:serine hydrolase domain-containing protein [Idiomarina xiamenensis]EKE83712.1 beta-lactamase [Idiomarina xiamenensis 10-D-4]
MKATTIAIALAACACFKLTTGQAMTFSDAAIARIEQHFPNTIKTLYAEHKLKGDFLIAVVDNQGLRYWYTINEQGTTPATNGLSLHRPFLVASHTKAFIGTLAQRLASTNRFDLDASLDVYLDDEVRNDEIAKKQITMTQLLNHTAGFTSVLHTFKSAFLGYRDDNDLINALNTDTLVISPGQFRYSNTGPILAAHAMQKATATDWQQLLKKEIFKPLAMHDSSASLSDYEAGTVLPSIEVGKDGEVIRTGLYKTDKTLHASGGVVSTLADMSKWLSFNLRDGKELSSSGSFFKPLHHATAIQHKRYFTYDRTGYSLAWDIADYHDNELLTRFGGYGGISLHASFMPKQGIAVVAYFNDERGFVLPHLAANYIYNLALSPDRAQERYEEEYQLFKRSFAKQQQQALDAANQIVFSQDWQPMMGIYQAEQGWPTMEFFVKSDHVWARWGLLSGPLYRLPHQQGSYVAAFGPIRRTITIPSQQQSVLTFRNGSINYQKVSD